MTQLLQNAAYGTALILTVAVLRGTLKDRLLPEARLALWAVCLFRLFTPIAPTSPLSLWGLFGWGTRELPVSAPAAPTAPAAPAGPLPLWELPASAPAAPAAPTAPSASTVLTAVWVAVGAILAARYALAYARTRRAVGRAILLGREDARYAALPKCARLREGPLDGAPLTFGVARPTVVLTPGLDGAELACVLAHEGVHARRRDNLWHYAAAAALTVFWWDPAVWLMARLIRRDVELSCDRAAVRRLGTDRRAEYAGALVTLATRGDDPAFCQTFGRKAAEERIISIMKYKKTTVAGIALTLALVLAVTVGFASSPGINMPDISSVTVTTEYRTPVAVQDYVLPERDGNELIRLINTYPKTVYPEGDTRTNDLLDVWARLNCDDGGYYVLHYSYCSGFSWNPLHFGEDDYYSLLTRFDASGNAGTTWKLDYDFDRPFIDWWADTAKRIHFVPDEEGVTSSAPGNALSNDVFAEIEDDFVHYDRSDPDSLLKAYQSILDGLVAQGELTQAAADDMLSRMEKLVERAKNGEIESLMFKATGDVIWYVERPDLTEADDQTGEEPQAGVNVFYADPENGISIEAWMREDLCTREDCNVLAHKHVDGKVIYCYPPDEIVINVPPLPRNNDLVLPAYIGD